MDKLAKYLLIILGVAFGLFICWYFSSILIYIAIAAVISLLGRPLMSLFGKIHYKKFTFPRWLAAIITVALIITIALSVLMLLTPLVAEIAGLLGSLNADNLSAQVREPLAKFNSFVISSYPAAGADFKVETLILDHLKDFFSLSTVGDLFNSVTGFVVNFGVAIFSIVFISFFFLLENGIITNSVVAMAADKYEEKVLRASASIKNLLTRYFLGIVIESFCIALLNSLGLMFLAKMPTNIAIVVGAISGIINVIPYIGPLIGDILALLMGIITHYSSGLESSLGVYLILILVVVVATQLIDNYVFQPVIYSSSVKAHPLEIFIVILMAGNIGGMLGMLVAIPCYTVFRVIAAEFLSKYKFVRKLTHSINTRDDS